MRVDLRFIKGFSKTRVGQNEVQILTPAREIDRQEKQKAKIINHKRYLTCEICHEQKKMKYMTSRCGHVICSKCARSPKRQRQALLKERKSLIEGKGRFFIRRPEYQTLLDIYRAEGLSYNQIKKRLENLKNQLAVTKELRKFNKEKGTESKASSSNFKESFAQLTQKRSEGRRDD